MPLSTASAEEMGISHISNVKIKFSHIAEGLCLSWNSSGFAGVC